MKYLIYARVSPKGSGFDNETSLDMQIKLCEEYIKNQRGTVTEIITDEFFSGKDMKRPGFQKILNELQSGQSDWDCICVYKLSRMTRSSKDGAYIFDLLKTWNKGFISVTEPNFDFSTPMGRAMLSIFQAFNQFEREQTAENTRNRMISIAAAGGWPAGNPPFGYKRGAKHDNILKIDPRNSQIVKEIFSLYLSDMKLYKIAKRFQKAPQSILFILRNPIYIGKIAYAGKIYNGKHPALISDTIFQQVQDTLASSINQEISEARIRVRPKSQSRIYLLCGLLRCHCGRYMTPASSNSGSYFYYRCTDRINCKNNVPAIEIENAVCEQLKNHKPDIHFLRGFADRLNHYQQERKKLYVSELKEIKLAITEARKEQKKIYDIFLSGTISKDNSAFFNDRLQSTNEELMGLEAKKEFIKAEIDRADNNMTDVMESMIKEMLTMADYLQKMPEDSESRKRLILAYIDRVTVNEDKTIKIEFKNFTTNAENGCPTWTRTKTN